MNATLYCVGVNVQSKCWSWSTQSGSRIKKTVLCWALSSIDLLVNPSTIVGHISVAAISNSKILPFIWMMRAVSSLYYRQKQNHCFHNHILHFGLWEVESVSEHQTTEVVYNSQYWTEPIHTEVSMSLDILKAVVSAAKLYDCRN